MSSSSTSVGITAERREYVTRIHPVLMKPEDVYDLRELLVAAETARDYWKDRAQRAEQAAPSGGDA